MIKRLMLLCATCVVSACATPRGLDASDSSGFARVQNDGSNAEFENLVRLIGQDSALLSKKSREMNIADGGFGLAVLAAAAYGAFNTTYGGNNLKDAAFAAASLGSLRTFLNPGERRNQYAEAGDALKCVYEYGSIFAGDPPAVDVQAIQRVVTMMGLPFHQSENSKDSAIKSLPSIFESSIYFGADGEFASSAVDGKVPVEVAREAVANARRVDMAMSALAGIRAASDENEEAYKQRFVLVTKKYLEIVAKLHKSNRFSSREFQTSIDEYKTAVKKATEVKTNSENGARTIAMLAGFNGLTAQAAADEIGKYAQAKADLMACGGVKQ